MKLKDIFPKWLLRERAYGELELGGGSFAHLTEDTGTSRLVVDSAWPVVAPSGLILTTQDEYDGEPGQSFIEMGQNLYTHWLPGSAVTTETVWKIETWDGPGGADILQIKADGSHHWGDGTAAPDTTLRRSDPDTWGTGLTLIDSDEGGLVVGDPAGDHYITLYPSSMYVSIYDAREAGVANTTLSAGQLHMRKNSHEVGIEPSTTGHLAIVETGSGLEVKSPDGTAYVLAPPNGGGAAVWYPA